MYKILKDPITNQNAVILRLIDNAGIPFAPNNTDYQQYLKWLEAGNKPLPADK